jgi:hypothetical protein
MIDLNPHIVLAPSSPRHKPRDNQMRPRPSPPYPVGGEDADVLAPRPRPGLRILAETIAETLPLLAARTRHYPHGVPMAPLPPTQPQPGDRMPEPIRLTVLVDTDPALAAMRNLSNTVAEFQTALNTAIADFHNALAKTTRATVEAAEDTPTP